MKIMEYLLKQASSLAAALAVAAVLTQTTVLAQAAEQIFTGTIQDLPPSEENIMVIGGRTVVFALGDTEVFLNGSPLNPAFLDVGMVVRCTVNAQGVLLKMEVLGPMDKLRIITNN